MSEVKETSGRFSLEEVCMLLHNSGKTVDEIAEMLDIPDTTVMRIIAKKTVMTKEVHEDRNMTVGQLKECLKDIPDDIHVIFAVPDTVDTNHVYGYRYIRTAGILTDHLVEGSGMEDATTLCLAVTAGGLDLHGLLEENKEYSHITCEKVLY